MKAVDDKLTQKMMHPFIMKDWRELKNKDPYYAMAKKYFTCYKHLLALWKEKGGSSVASRSSPKTPKR